MFEYLLALILGIIAGTITGIIPGIHTNLVAATIIGTISLKQFFQFQPIIIIIFIVAMAITHTFLDFIPSIFFGAPDTDTALSVLPGHDLLKKGQGHYAFILTLYGSTIAIISLLILIPLMIFLVPLISKFIERMMAFFLIWISFFMIFHEKNQKVLSALIFFLAGFLGFSTLNMEISQPLLPLLAGLFGSSSIIYSIKSKSIIPKQKIVSLKISRKGLIKLLRPSILAATIAPIFSFFPGLGSSQAAIVASQLDKKQTKENFLVVLGAINTLVISISFVTLFLIGKSRTGAAAAINELTNITSFELLIIFVTIAITALICVPLSNQIAKKVSKNIHRINYQKISGGILAILTVIVMIFSGVLGFFVFVVSTVLGLTTIEYGLRRGLLMGCILIPTIIFYLPF